MNCKTHFELDSININRDTHARALIFLICSSWSGGLLALPGRLCFVICSLYAFIIINFASLNKILHFFSNIHIDGLSVSSALCVIFVISGILTWNVSCTYIKICFSLFHFFFERGPSINLFILHSLSHGCNVFNFGQKLNNIALNRTLLIKKIHFD